MRINKKSKSVIILAFFSVLFLLVFYNYRGFAQNSQIKNAPAEKGNKEEEKKKLLRIISPLPDSTYNPGQEIDLEIEADEKIIGVSVVMTSGEHFILQERPFSKRIAIPENFNSDKISVIAVGVGKDGPSGVDVISLKVNVDIGSFLPPNQDSGAAN